MNKRSQEPEFGATGQFELTGVYFVDKKADAAFATTLGVERIKTLLLLGAGPAHLQVLAQLATHRRSDLDVTLINPWSYSTYPNGVAGFVAGERLLEECQIDLRPLLRDSGVRWINARCGGVDADTRSVMLDYGGGFGATQVGASTSRPTLLNYDLLSIDTGPSTDRRVPGATEHALSLWPAEQFVNRWAQALNQLRGQPGRQVNLTLIGHSAQAVEMAFAVRQGLEAAGVSAVVRLLAHADAVLPHQSASMQKRVVAQLRKRQIDVVLQRCTRVQAGGVSLDDGTSLPSDLTLMAVQGSAPDWLQHSGLAQDPEGFVTVNATLQSTTHKDVFVASEVARRADRSERGGIDSTRAGPDLALNLLASVTEQPLTTHNPPERRLGLIRCGKGHGIAHWGGLSAEGGWASRWKDKADRAFLARFRR